MIAVLSAFGGIAPLHLFKIKNSSNAITAATTTPSTHGKFLGDDFSNFPLRILYYFLLGQVASFGICQGEPFLSCVAFGIFPSRHHFCTCVWDTPHCSAASFVPISAIISTSFYFCWQTHANYISALLFAIIIVAHCVCQAYF